MNNQCQADLHQLWTLNVTSGLLQDGVYESATRCVDVNNHQKLNGTVASLGDCTSTWHWGYLKPTRGKQGTVTQIESVEAPGFPNATKSIAPNAFPNEGLCLTYHKEPPPPPPPPGPSPLPKEAINQIRVRIGSPTEP